MVAPLLVWLAWTSNPVTPAGYVGYITRGAILGKSEFVELQTGPTSTGRGWMLHAVNVSVTPYSFAEEFEVQTTLLLALAERRLFGVFIQFDVTAQRQPLPKAPVQDHQDARAMHDEDRDGEINFLVNVGHAGK